MCVIEYADLYKRAKNNLCVNDKYLIRQNSKE